MSISHWPSRERPREKLLERGAAALSDAELLAIFLRTGVAGVTAVDLARALLQRFGGFGGLLAADRQAFCAAKGLGSAKFAQLQAVLELARRHLGEQLARDEVFSNPEAVSSFLQVALQNRKEEVFMVLFLDVRNRLITSEELFRGTLDGAGVYPREVLRRCLAHNAASVILAHNHPSGVAEPSQEDERITRRLRDALALVDIRVLDHIIVGAGCTVSLASRGVI